ncbi:MAG: hypothetical protein KJO38_04285, partial [Gammaproteobacteria bacterium]|nr:hypothetical protein [Gammaproteobacteria bacterium]
LWHWPLLVFARIRYADVANVELAAIVLALMLSALTWRYVETPFRRRGAGRRALVYRAALASTTVIALLSVGVAASSGMPGRAEAYGALQRDAGFDVPDAALLAGRGTPLGSPGPGTDFVVIGDSHASTLLPMLNDLAARARLSGLSLARAGRSPFGNVAGQEHIHAALLNIIESTRPSAVILVARWPNLFGRAAASRNYAENLALLEALVDAATAAGATVWVLPQVPEHALSRAAVRFQQLQALRHPGRHHAPTITRDEYAAATAAARDAFDRLQRRGARQLDISAHVFESAGPRAGQLVRGPAGMLLYWDNHHLTQSGARHLLSPLFAPLFAELAAGGAADIRKGQPRPGR